MIPETSNPDGTGWHLRNIVVLCIVLATIAVCVFVGLWVWQDVQCSATHLPASFCH